MRKIIETNEMFRKAVNGKEKLEGYLINGITLTSKDFGEGVPWEEWCAEYNNVTFHNVKFEEIELDTFLFVNCTFVDSVFNRCIMKYTKFGNCEISSTIFENTNIMSSQLVDSILSCVEFRKCDFSIENKFQNCHCTPVGRFLFNKCNFIEHLVMRSSRIPLENLVSNKADLKKIIFDMCGSSLFDHPLVYVGPIGSRKKFTTYIPHIDWIQCGCWTDDEDNPDPNTFCGGHLDAFEKRVQKVYPKGKYHDQYMAAIQLFKVYRDQYYKKEKENE